MSKLKFLGFALAIVFGGFMFVYGEIDDSPGGQLLGLVIAIIGIVGIFEALRGKLFR